MASNKDWEPVAEEYQHSKAVVIADVDCTATDAKELCDKYEVKLHALPLWKYFYDPETTETTEEDEEGESDGDIYMGRQGLREFRLWARHLDECSIDNLHKCTEEQADQIDRYARMSLERREGKIRFLENVVKKQETATKALLDHAMKLLEESWEKLDRLHTAFRLLHQAHTTHTSNA